MLCERCGTDNPNDAVVCIECYYAVGIPYNPGVKAARKKSSPKAAPWAAEMELTDVEVRQVVSKLGDALKDGVVAYWFTSREDAADAEKGLADTIGQAIKAGRVKVAVLARQDRAALFIAGKLDQPDLVRTTVEAFNGQPALGGTPAAAAR